VIITSLISQLLMIYLALNRDAGLEFEQACYAQVIPTEDRLEGE
jgi:hypothetical protein